MSGPPYHGRTHLLGGSDPIPDFVNGFDAIYFATAKTVSSITDGDVAWNGCDIQTNDGGVQLISGASSFTGTYFTASYLASFDVVSIQQTGIYTVNAAYWIENQSGLSAFQMYVGCFSSGGAAIVRPAISSARGVQQSSTGFTLADLESWVVATNFTLNVTTAPYSMKVKVSQSAGATITSTNWAEFVVMRLSD